MPPADSLLRDLLLYGLLPLWLAAGLADALCHRQQHIEHTAGWRESALHLLMLGELGAGLVAALLMQINAAVLVLLLVCCLAHEVTTWVDLAYANARRRIPPFEQWVHAVQLALPWAGFVGIVLLHADQAGAAFGLSDVQADWSLRWKDPPLPAAYLSTVLLAAVLLVIVPFAAEWRRALRAAHAADTGPPPRMSSR